MNVFGLVVPVNQRTADPSTPPFRPDHPDLKMFRYLNGWAVVWIIKVQGMEFGISPNWALSAARQITRDWILPEGFQSGEAVVVMFDFEDGYPEDISYLVERYDWTTDIEPPKPPPIQGHR